MNLSRRDARLSRVGLGQERIELLAGAFHASGSVCVQRARVTGAAPGWWSGVAWPISTDATLG
jgi:hypothetical protein